MRSNPPRTEAISQSQEFQCVRESRVSSFLGVFGFALILSVLCVSGLFHVSSAFAEEARPGWEVIGRANPSNLAPGEEGQIILHVFNIGAAGGEATVVNTLPEGVHSTSPFPGCTGIGTRIVTCKTAPPPGGSPAGIVLPIIAASDAHGEASDKVTISGGGALSIADASIPIKFSSEPAAFGFADFDAWLSKENGTVDTQAGSHPFEFTVAFTVNSIGTPRNSENAAGGEFRDIDVKLPPGLIGNAQVTPRCPREKFAENEIGEKSGEGCPRNTQIGLDTPELAGLDGGTVDIPIFNLVPPTGYVAQFGFTIAGITSLLDVRVRSGGNYGLTTHVDNVPQKGILTNVTTIWGVPGAAIHDHERTGEGCPRDGYIGVPCEFGGTPLPFLSAPTSCGEPQQISGEFLGAWQDESLTAKASVLTHNTEGIPVGFTGCEKLVHFEPLATITPESSFTDTPSGLTTDVTIAQGENPEELATSSLEDTAVTLPEGVVINPGQATGLVACQPSQENIGGPEAEQESEDGPSSCPLASKVGTDEVTTPLVADKLVGSVYILSPNPPNLELLVTASGDGVNLKLVGHVHLNEATGQLVTTFEHTPDAPFTDFKLSFSGGTQAALATPTRCGTYGSLAVFTPWASPFVESSLSTSSFDIAAGPGGSACQWPLPFTPTMTAGATTDQAGGYTAFTMLLQRGDGQQRIGKLQFKTPEGLLGMISQVQLCEEPQAATGNCPSGSQIGHTVATGGPGPYPFEVPQSGGPPAPIYLTGPYNGAPFGLSIVVPVVAGPFNLGTVVIRGTIEVDPHTSRLTITTGALPTILAGVPTDLRAIDAVIDRPDFMFNPTNCAPMSFSGTATSTEGVTAPLESHFQVGSCQALKFAPNFKVSTSGKTSRTNGASLTAKIIYPTGNLGFNQASSQSNINSIKVDLPKQLPSRLTTLQKACTAATFNANPANCPAASIVGHARALTPLLPVPIEGPAYFVSHAGEEFPNLVIVLKGDNVAVNLVGDTFISKAGITSSTFKQVPDVPIGLFELYFPQGKYSALAANTNLCKSSLKMPTSFIAQNGAVLHQTTPVTVTGCPKHKATKKTKKTKGANHKKAKGNKKG
jgi:hypothetical protein